MKITFSFPDDSAERVSRHRALVEAIERESGSLGEYAATFDWQRREFRESFDGAEETLDIRALRDQIGMLPGYDYKSLRQEKL